MGEAARSKLPAYGRFRFGQPPPNTHHIEGAHTMLKGWWPTEEEAKQRLEPSGWHQQEDGRWRAPGGLVHSEEAAVAVAQVRLALGYEDVTDVLTSEAFAQLVRRLVDLEAKHNHD
jgi:hypothetical protein